ncbi:MAG TPA: endonuclease III [Candidatus Nanoarchaeia archaeon]|nr:endonuclease III [Candidatus Nanoarchaeia archaeon]
MQIKRIFRTLEKVHQPTMLELLGNYKPFQLLVMTSLSARSKDSTVIPIVKEMFAKYPNPEDFVKINIKELEKIIFKIGFYRTKSKHIKELSKIIISQYHGKIPEAFEDLISLPGVGRKTANCILNYAFRKPAIAVDVHVHRISNRLGWIKTKTPEETEEALKKIVPKEEWINVNKLLVGHGQTICSPIKPNCPKCSINSYCDYNR